MPASEHRKSDDCANNSWLLCFDNLSYLRVWLSDALCRLSTGGGFSKRKLYLDVEEVLINVRRPGILTGIGGTAERQDLLDRAISVRLKPISDQERITERELIEKFEAARPRILGALLEAVSVALRKQDSVSLESAPRMADFAKWCVSAEPALPWPEGTFLDAYTGNRSDSVEQALATDPVAVEIRNLALDEDGRVEFTATDLLVELTDSAPESVIRTRAWPKSAPQLAEYLARIAPSLRQVGWEITKRRRPGTGERVTEIWNRNYEPPPAEDRDGYYPV